MRRDNAGTEHVLYIPTGDMANNDEY